MRKAVKALSFLLIIVFVISCGGCQQAPLCVSEDFIQVWLCRDWTVAEWETHIQKLKNKGYTTIILQSSAEVQEGVITESYFICKDFDCEQFSTVENLFQACRNTDFMARIGLVDDVSWWGEITEQSVQVWADLMSSISRALYDKFADAYSEEFAGLYWTFEMYTQNKGYETLWAQLINDLLATIEEFPTETSLLFSPFYSNYYGISTAECAAMWKNLFTSCNLRSIDIFAPQDGYGQGKALPTEDIDEKVSNYLKAARNACRKYSKARFFVNLELYTDQTGVYATGDRIQRQKEIAKQFRAQGLITFSYSHYYCQ